MPEEAAALSVLALVDLHDAAEQAGGPILDRLHESAFALLEQMLPTEPLAGRSPNPPPELVPACLGMARSLVG